MPAPLPVLVLPSLYGFALVLFRVTGLCMVAPVFGMKPVPARVRLALSLALSGALFLGAGAPPVAVPGTFLALGAAAIGETLIGLVAGSCARFALDAVGAAGQVAGLTMGLGYGSMLDPLNGQESTVLAQLLSYAALGIALALGIHREAIAWLAGSLRAVPPGSAVDYHALFTAVVTQALLTTALAVRLAFPIIAAATFGHALLGALGRVAPQLNLSNVGFSVALLAGGWALFLAAPAMAELAARQALASFSQH